LTEEKNFYIYNSIVFSLFPFPFPKNQTPLESCCRKINPSNYFGETVANGVIGVVSSAKPFKCKDAVLCGAYDQYGRERVGNFLKSLNPRKYEFVCCTPEGIVQIKNSLPSTWKSLTIKGVGMEKKTFVKK
jgi:hypothetical protein